MGIETLMVAVGPTEESRVNELTNAIVDLAAQTDATVVLFHAFTESAFEEGVRETGFETDDPPEPEAVAARLESIDAITEQLDDSEVEYEIRSAIGSTRDTVLGGISEIGADLLMIGGRKRSPVGKAVVGSTSQRLLMNAPCPVVFVREGIDD